MKITTDLTFLQGVHQKTVLLFSAKLILRDTVIFICIIAGALLMFSAQGCVSDIRPSRECIKNNTVPRAVFSRTPPS